MVTGILILSALLAIGFLATRLASALNIPHSVFLVIFGIFTGLITRQWYPEIVSKLTHRFPDIILFALLPPLIFESAYHIQFNDLKRNMAPITILAILGISLSTVFVAGGLNVVFAIDWLPALVFGALISATDPVAVVALFKEIGAPLRLNTLIEGESLFNDGAAIVIFHILVTTTMSTMVTGQLTGVETASIVYQGILRFFVVFVGGICVGLVVSMVLSIFLHLTKSGTGQLGLTVSAAYISFLLSDHVFHMSGVMSTVVTGMYLGNRARLEFNKEALHGMHYLWEFLALSANTIVFLGLGLSIQLETLKEAFRYIPFTIAIVYLSRPIAIFTLIPTTVRLRLCRPVSLAYQVVMVWGGLRGGLAIALVLMLPESFPYKHVFMAMAAAVVLSNLIINALTIGPMIRLLGLDEMSKRQEDSHSRVMKAISEEVFKPLKVAGAMGVISNNIVRSVSSQVKSQIAGETHESDLETMVDFELNKLLHNEQDYYDKMIEEGVLTKMAWRQLCVKVQDRLEIFEDDGVESLHSYSFEHTGWHWPIEKWWQNTTSFLRKDNKLQQLGLDLEILFHQNIAIQKAFDSINGKTVQGVAKSWLTTTNEKLKNFYRLYPDVGSCMQAMFITNTFNVSATTALDEYFKKHVIDGIVFAKSKKILNRILQQGLKDSKYYLKPTTEYLIRRVPIFAKLPTEAISALAAGAQVVEVSAHTNAIKEGDAGDSIFIVTSGLMEVSGSTIQSNQKPNLFTGDFFGEMSLIEKSNRTATVEAIVDSHVLEINDKVLGVVMKNFPSIRQEFEAVVNLRRIENATKR